MKTNNPINIFIVDDNKTFSLALKSDIETAFMNIPIKIYSFETGEKCMERFMQIMPELAILDYHLNSKTEEAEDGLRTLQKIKQANAETCVIMLSMNDHIDIALKSFHHGASDYVVKTDTQFKKINSSISNFLKMMAVKNEARKYKRMLLTLFLLMALFTGGVLAIQIFTPILLK